MVEYYLKFMEYMKDVSSEGKKMQHIELGQSLELQKHVKSDSNIS